MQVCRVAFLEVAVGEPEALGPGVAGLHEVARDVDPQHVRPEGSGRYCGRPVTTSKVQDLETARDRQVLDERLTCGYERIRQFCPVSKAAEIVCRR